MFLSTKVIGEGDALQEIDHGTLRCAALGFDETAEIGFLFAKTTGRGVSESLGFPLLCTENGGDSKWAC